MNKYENDYERDYETYEAYENDRLCHGSNVKIEHTVGCKDFDMTELVTKSRKELEAIRKNCADKEQAAYEKIIKAAEQWEPFAVQTRQIDRAIEYLDVPAVRHSSNKWIDDENDWKSISNMVYKMSYRVYDYKSNRTGSRRWDLDWKILTNSPYRYYNTVITEQRRTFQSEEDMNKYLQGRIKVYSHLFTEISPPVPDKYIKAFCVYGQLLPNYRRASDLTKELKSSVRSRLKSIKAQEKKTPSKVPVNKREGQEL
ncbi:MAG: hypothetical protein LIO59_04770 [Oscillospiraceae bacterium]|nr:hypothetical protein [Oscillospiraceae bacterium]